MKLSLANLTELEHLDLSNCDKIRDFSALEGLTNISVLDLYSCSIDDISFAPFYNGYCHTTMTISALGNPQSPVRTVFNIWMLLEGILLLLSLPALSERYGSISKPLSVTVIIFTAVFAVGACIFTCFFSVNETKDVVTTASRIHGAGSVTGFLLFLFVPLLMAILEFRSGNGLVGAVSVISFIFALVFFVLFVMADKPEFSNTVIAKEGLWQRLNIVFMYLPFIFISLRSIIIKQ